MAADLSPSTTTGTRAAAPFDWIYLVHVLGRRYALDTRLGTRLELSGATLDYLERQSPPDPAGEVLEELASLADVETPRAADQVPPSLMELTLNVAHACNLKCAYCFEDWPNLKSGFDRPGQGLMSEETARKSVDLLIASSGDVRDLTIAFFGGEPLLNFDVVKATVSYAHEQARIHDKRFDFSLTTNGTRLTAEVQEFLVRNDFGVLISIDGPAEMHDRLRRFHNDAPSHALVLRHAKELARLIEESPDTRCHITARGTYVRQTMDFERAIYALVDEGFDDISVENGVMREDHAIALRQSDLPELERRYEHFVERMTEDLITGRHRFRHFHMQRALEALAVSQPSLRECGAGVGYMAVSADGDLFPCHTFVGASELKVGDVDAGVTRPETGRRLWDINIDTKEPCRTCWARTLCGGGCHAHAYHTSGRLENPDPVTCALMQHRLRLGLYMLDRLEQEAPQVLRELLPEYIAASASPERPAGLRCVAHGEGLVIYDPARRKLHRLDRLEARLWQACDGRTPYSEIVAETAEELHTPPIPLHARAREALRSLQDRQLIRIG